MVNALCKVEVSYLCINECKCRESDQALTAHTGGCAFHMLSVCCMERTDYTGHVAMHMQAERLPRAVSGMYKPKLTPNKYMHIVT